MRVLFIDVVHEVLEERLKEVGFETIDGTGLTRNECVTILESGCDGLVVRSRFAMDEEFLEHGKQLKFIARSGAGMENIDLDYCEKRNITLFNAPEGNRNAVGEHALGMLLSLFNNLNKGDREIRDGKWDREGNRGVELDGKTVGIIGFGNNGKAFAKKLRGFEVEVLAYDKYKKGFGTSQVNESTLEEIFQKADVLSFHIPQNKETMYMANDVFFESFKKNIYLLNMARGKIVRTTALTKALENGKVLGACLDVLEFEKASFENMFSGDVPEDFNYLLQSNKVILSPHVAGWTNESYYKLSNVLADKILAKFKP